MRKRGKAKGEEDWESDLAQEHRPRSERDIRGSIGRESSPNEHFDTQACAQCERCDDRSEEQQYERLRSQSGFGDIDDRGDDDRQDKDDEQQGDDGEQCSAFEHA